MLIELCVDIIDMAPVW